MSTDPATCIFCRIVAGEIPSTVVAENEQAIAIRDLGPVAPTHVLVLPRRHVLDASGLHGGESALLVSLFELANQVAIAEGIATSGFRLVTNVGEDGGQTVGHLHFHLLGGRPLGWPPG